MNAVDAAGFLLACCLAAPALLAVIVVSRMVWEAIREWRQIRRLIELLQLESAYRLESKER